MAANTKKELANIIDDQDLRKKFKAALANRTSLMQIADDHKETLKENLASISEEFKVEKKIVSKMAKVMYNANYGSLLEENRHFEQLYEQVIEGKLRDPSEAYDPLDSDDSEE